MEKQLLTVGEVAVMLRVSTRTIRRLINTDTMNALIVGGQYRITPKQVQDYLDSKGHING